jgi:hypothetical protein
MSIEKTDKIDLLGLNKETGNIELAIIDPLSWNNTDYHLQLLQDKVNAYLSFIESGEIYDVYPEANNHKFKIIVYINYQPNEFGNNFIRKLGKILSDAGYGFQLKLQIDDE